MLMRFFEVTKEGKILQKGNLKVLYSVMMHIRTLIVVSSGKSLSLASVLGIRYACVRRQFANQENSPLERKLIDYQTQQHKLFPPLAFSYSFLITGKFVAKVHQQLLKDIEKNEFTLLDLCHHLTAGFKAYMSHYTYLQLAEIRQACGGAGFSVWSEIPYVLGKYAPTPTFEGDTTVMYHQGVRLLLKTYKYLKGGMKATGIFEYLN